MRVIELLLEVATDADLQDAFRRVRKSAEYEDAVAAGFSIEKIDSNSFQLLNKDGESIDSGYHMSWNIKQDAAYSKDALRRHHAAEIARHIITSIAKALDAREEKHRVASSAKTVNYIRDELEKYRVGKVRVDVNGDHLHVWWDEIDPENGNKEHEDIIDKVSHTFATISHVAQPGRPLYRPDESYLTVMFDHNRKLDLHSLHADPTSLDKPQADHETTVEKLVHELIAAGMPKEYFIWPLQMNKANNNAIRVAVDPKFNEDPRPIPKGPILKLVRKIFATGVENGQINLNLFDEPLTIKSAAYKYKTGGDWRGRNMYTMEHPGVKIMLKDF